jgi:serine/threonine protein kinase
MSLTQFEEALAKLYYPIQILGQGAFGTVWHCDSKETLETLAVKVVKIKHHGKEEMNSLLQEARLLKTLNHPHVVHLKGVKRTEKFLFFEMELLKGGTLSDKLSSKLTEPEAVSIMKSLLEGVAYLHSKNIVHRDLKPENILFKDSSLASLKITDFGLSGKMSVDYTLDDMCGTALFMAPEQARHRHYSEAVDIWSCGIIMYMMLENNHPLYTKGEGTSSYFRKLENPVWQFSSGFPELAKDLFQHLVKVNPVDRYTAENALKHPWITGNLEGEIPKTYSEKMQIIQSNEKICKLFSAAIFLAALYPVDIENYKATLFGKPQIRFSGPMKYKIQHDERGSKIFDLAKDADTSSILRHSSLSEYLKPKTSSLSLPYKALRPIVSTSKRSVTNTKFLEPRLTQIRNEYLTPSPSGVRKKLVSRSPAPKLRSSSKSPIPDKQYIKSITLPRSTFNRQTSSTEKTHLPPLYNIRNILA